MSNCNDKLKSQKRKDMEFFFGKDIKMKGNNYFTFPRIQGDTIIILTNNIKYFPKKESYVLVLGKKTGLWLKDWQIRPVANYQNGINAYAVKITKQYFNPYIFNENIFEAFFNEDTEDTFESLLEVAKAQEKENMPIRQGVLND